MTNRRWRLSGLMRLRLLQGAFAILFLALGVQVLRFQVLDRQLPPQFTDGAAPRIVQSDPVRGLITDRHGAVLARNVPEFSVALVPGELPQDEAARRRTLVGLESLLGVPYAQLESVVSSHLAQVDAHTPLTVRTGLDADEAITLRAALAGKPYARVQSASARVYEPDGSLAHILGYVGSIPADEIETLVEDGYRFDGRIGLAGVEGQYEPMLRGEPGSRLVLADPTGRELSELAAIEPEPGGNVALSIDLELQRVAEDALRRGIEAGLSTVRPSAERPAPVPGGAAIVMDVRSGEVLALVSLPSYDANLFTGDVDTDELTRVLNDPGRPLIDRTYMEMRSPGSVFKPLVAYAALVEGVSTPNTLITSTGALTVRSPYDGSAVAVFRDWAAHGTLDLNNAIARSSNVYFYYLGGGYQEGGQQIFEGLGAQRLADWTREFGFGRPTGIDLPGETGGLVPDPEWKEETAGDPWVLGDTYTFSIGQGYLSVSPLQMAVMTAAIANGGDLLVPRVVRGVEYEDGFEQTPRRTSDRLSGAADHLHAVQRAMHAAAMQANGTARTGVPAGMVMAGKTGTAEFGMPYPDMQYDSHGWYIGFAPYDEPEIAVTVYLEYGVGATHAGPVAREILEAYFEGTSPGDEGGDQRAAAP